MSHRVFGCWLAVRWAACLLAVLAVGGRAVAAGEDVLVFDATRYVPRTVTVGEQTVACRAYEGLVYVARPVDARSECMNVYVPAAYFEGQAVGGYTADAAPIFLPNQVGGYMPGSPGQPGVGRDGSPNAISRALVHGYVVASPGARGRTQRSADGTNYGKAPACIVDLKAAVRYLRHNDPAMPGNAERIITSGTSAGGALSALLGGTGNHADYEPALRALGAADARDDVFAASCYCPITNLDHADAAYEWLFGGVNDYAGFGEHGTLNAEQTRVSAELKRLFPAYVNSLGLKSGDGAALALDADGGGSFAAYVNAFVLASAQQAIDTGADLSGLGWLTLDGRRAVAMDLAGYARFATRMKTPPAFDALDLRSPETDLFGSATVAAQHFTAYAKEQSADHSLAEAAAVRMMNPMAYIGTPGTTIAPHWRIRHGAVDRDTSLAIPIILGTRLRNSGAQVDLALPWGVGHGGDYDLPELFAWIDGLCR